MKKFLLSLLVLFSVGFAQQERVAIINTVDDGDSIKPSDLTYLTDRLRGAAVKALPKQRYGVMTTESIVAFLGSQERAQKECKEASCLAELGRKVSADYVAQARIGRFNKNLTIKTELYSSKSGVMIGSFTGDSKSLQGLLDLINKEAPLLFKELLDITSTAPTPSPTPMPPVTEKTLDKLNDAKSFIDSRDGKKYRTVVIGKQTWMAENLNYNARDSKCYDDKSANCDKYGKLYYWNAAVKACPVGWHLPTKTEWDELLRFVDGTSSTENSYSETAGKYLKAKSGWNDYEKKSSNGTDDYGFAALPGGFGGYVVLPDGNFSEEFHNVGVSGSWWSDSGELIMNRTSGAYWDDKAHKKSFLFSVRCLYGSPSDTQTNMQVIDGRDGKKYKTVKIGTQTWMAENLNYNASGKCYDNKPANCDKYGRLYNWNTAKTACPNGWHLPDDMEWDKLYRFADGTKGTSSPYNSETAGKYLKAASGWIENGNGTDKFGFAALPSGYGDSRGFRGAGDFGGWWSASEDNSYAYMRSMFYNGEDAGWRDAGKSLLFSVRCLQN
ncbi:MAG: fibrobacter succinogenes major paralogous domain-containing protein [Fibromonadales bacterium]|jgi:Fibrobacter succinogenes major domain (Fib_succ_major).|nr:fibrobacter succinogenes major paralogous domain-containing protein [Fibromonadales bacterium]